MLKAVCRKVPPMPPRPSPQCQLTAPVSWSHAFPFHFYLLCLSLRGRFRICPPPVPFYPPAHPLWQPVPSSSHQLHRMKIRLKRAVAPKLSLWMCLGPFPWSYLRSLQRPLLPPFSSACARSSLDVQSLLARASEVPLWQAHIHAATQSPCPIWVPCLAVPS